MNAVYWHLAINHFPVMGVMFATLIMAFALIRRQKDVWRVGLALLVLSGVLGIFAYRTGEAAEEIVEEDAALSHDAIEAHEDAGKRAMWLAALIGAAALIGLIAFRARAMPGWYKGAMLVGALLTSLMMGVAANRGSQIEHAEHMGGAVAAEHEAEEP